MRPRLEEGLAQGLEEAVYPCGCLPLTPRLGSRRLDRPLVSLLLQEAGGLPRVQL